MSDITNNYTAMRAAPHVPRYPTDPMGPYEEVIEKA